MSNAHKYRTINKYFIVLSVLLLIFLSGQSAPAEETFQFDDVIRMLDHSGEQFNYLGTKFVIDFTPTRRSTTLVKVAYGAPGWQKKEVSSLQHGESQIILDDGKFLWHYIPSQASVVKKKRRLSLGELSKRIHRQKDLIQQNYHIIIEKHQPRLLGVKTSQIPSVIGDLVVSFRPKAQDRPSWKIWVDSEHGFVVRTEIYNLNGELALLSAFSELTFEPKFSKETFVMTVPKGTQVKNVVDQIFPTIKDAQQHVGFTISPPGYIPDGFILSSVILHADDRGEKVQMTYIDGMSAISLFEERRIVTAESNEASSKEVTINNTIKGTFHDHGLLKILNWQLDQNLYVTLVGEVADSELLKIASSISSQ